MVIYLNEENIDLHNKQNINHKAIYVFHDTRFLGLVRFGFDMLVFNIKQPDLEYILRRTNQNLKRATPIQKTNNIR